jgi:hypothetical protein
VSDLASVLLPGVGVDVPLHAGPGAEDRDQVLPGGGVWNGAFGGPPPELTLTRSVIAGNRLEGPSGFVIRGGGLWTATPVTLARTTLGGNRPDQCFGC